MCIGKSGVRYASYAKVANRCAPAFAGKCCEPLCSVLIAISVKQSLYIKKSGEPSHTGFLTHAHMFTPPQVYP